MPNLKKIIADWNETGKTVYAIARRESDGFLLNDADGTFAATPAVPYISLPEHAVIKGRYEVNESRTVWNDGRYTVAVYKQAGASPVPAADRIVCSGEMVIKDDLEVYLDALPSFIHKWITNKLVEEPAGTWKLYDDDGTTVLKMWVWDSTTKTRQRAI